MKKIELEFNATQLEEGLIRLTLQLHDCIKEKGFVKSAEFFGYKHADVHEWYFGKRKWSYAKIIKCAKKFNL